MRHLTLVLLSLAAIAGRPAGAQPQEVTVPRYKEICDASTAVAVGSNRFLVSNDEKNKLWLYQVDKPEPVAELDVKPHLVLQGDKEADIEGSAMLGDTLYWITSHGRNKKGELDPNRYQLFVLTPKVGPDGAISLTATGKPYTQLMQDMLEEPRLSPFKLAPLTPAVDKQLAPEASGSTNIEGLAAWRGSQLLIAFRNPVRGGKALLVPLENPAGVIKVPAEKARFGDPFQLDLQGRGIRSIEYWPTRDAYLIVAGPFNDEGAFQLYRWCGDPAHQPEAIEGADLSGLRPEAIVIDPEHPDEILLLSDDGGVKTGDVECKDLPKDKRTFQARRISLRSQPR